MWQHDFWMKQIFSSSIFLSENTGQLAKQVGCPVTIFGTLCKIFEFLVASVALTIKAVKDSKN
jgi:hypothetical protein